MTIAFVLFVHDSGLNEKGPKGKIDLPTDGRSKYLPFPLNKIKKDNIGQSNKKFAINLKSKTIFLPTKEHRFLSAVKIMLKYAR